MRTPSTEGKLLQHSTTLRSPLSNGHSRVTRCHLQEARSGASRPQPEEFDYLPIAYRQRETERRRGLHRAAMSVVVQQMTELFNNMKNLLEISAVSGEVGPS